jgi:hypothetical protein
LLDGAMHDTRSEPAVVTAQLGGERAYKRIAIAWCQRPRALITACSSLSFKEISDMVGQPLTPPCPAACLVLSAPGFTGGGVPVGALMPKGITSKHQAMPGPYAEPEGLDPGVIKEPDDNFTLGASAGAAVEQASCLI